ncbi:MAG: helix-turn-helix domain-containing protein [Acidimicrobiia bacterium]|nr:helix-turn-helix domain-containing protein [Acidimicrobiia bacterium]
MATRARNRHGARGMDSEAGQPVPGQPTPPLSATEFASAVTAISSAFGDPTRRDVFLLVHESEAGVTAAEVAERFGLHVNVARHHLDKLAAGGYVEVVVDRIRGSGAGRPSKRYRATAAELAAPMPIRHDVVLIQLLKRALELLPREQAEELAEEVGSDYGRAMASAMGDVAESQRSFRAALHMVADAMTAHGFDARVDGSGRDELKIVAEHCPYGGAEVIHPVLCAVDRGMVKGMLAALYGDSSPRLESSLLSGFDACTTAVDTPTGSHPVDTSH